MRVLLRAVKWVFISVLALVLGWLAFNNPLADLAPQARPAELLQAPPSGLPEQRNAFFALEALPSAPTPGPNVPPWTCNKDPSGCEDAAWLDQAPALRQHVLANESLVQQCERIVGDAAFAFEEPALQLLPGNAAATPMPRFAPINDCLRWLRARASVALADGDEAGMQAALQLADRLARAMLDHSRSLLGHAVGWSGARRNWQFVAAIAAKRPDLAPRLQQTVLRPLSAEALSSQRWIASEAAVNATITAELVQGCKRPVPGEQSQYPVADRFWCATRLGLLPNRTQQLFDQHWLEVLAASRQGPAAGMKSTVLQAADAPSWTPLAWRNTIGQMLFDVARPAYRDYLARQFDVELARQAAVLALGMDAVPATERVAWLRAQNIDPLLKGRFSLDGDTLVAHPWLAEVREQLEPREQIRIALAR